MPKAKEPRPTLQKYVAYWTEEGDCHGQLVAARADNELGKFFPICAIHVLTGITCGWESLWPAGERVPEERILLQADTFLGLVVRIERFRNTHNAEVPTT